MTDSTTRPPRTHAALSLAADGRWTGDRESLRRQLVVVEAEAAEIENTRWLEQSAIAERSRAEAAAPAPASESWLARGDHWLARDGAAAPDAGLRARHSLPDGRLHDADTCPDENHAGDLHDLLAAHPVPAPDYPTRPLTDSEKRGGWGHSDIKESPHPRPLPDVGAAPAGPAVGPDPCTGAPAPAHEHRWSKEYAPGYRQASEADDFMWVCDGCDETHGMKWAPQR